MSNACSSPSDPTAVPAGDVAVAQSTRVLVEEWPRRRQHLRGLTVHIQHHVLTDDELELIVPLLNNYHAGRITEHIFTTKALHAINYEAKYLGTMHKDLA